MSNLKSKVTIMKKNAYIAPTTNIIHVKIGHILNTISNPTKVNIEGLGISSDNYEDEIRSRELNIWDDED